MTYGNGLGQRLGFPTANILPSAPLSNVEDGVWAGYAEIDGKEYGCVANIGFSPSVVEGGSRRIEAHIMGFVGDLYNRKIAITLHYHLREERKFSSREELVAQISHDRDQALALLTKKQ